MTGRIFTYQEHIVTPGNWWPRCRWNLKQAKCQENQTGKCFNLSSNHQSSINIRKCFQFRVFAYSSCNKCLISICVYSVIQAASSLSQSVINRRSTHRHWGKTSSPRVCGEEERDDYLTNFVHFFASNCPKFHQMVWTGTRTLLLLQTGGTVWVTVAQVIIKTLSVFITTHRKIQ